MEEQELTIEEALQQMAGMAEVLDMSKGSALRHMAGLHKTRSNRLQKAEVRLEAELGSDHPRVVALRRAAARSEVLQRDMSNNAARAEKVPRLKPYEWMVYGRVLDSTGEPAVGLRVRVFDKDRTTDDLLGFTTTDEFGDFALVYHERTFYESGEGAPELYVQVEDGSGNVLYSSEDRIRRESGRIEYFEIVLGT